MGTENATIVVTRAPTAGTLREMQLTIVGLFAGVIAATLVQSGVFALWRIFKSSKPIPR
jgi:hypothetical protein